MVTADETPPSAEETANYTERLLAALTRFLGDDDSAQAARETALPPTTPYQPGPEVPELPDVPGPHRWPLFGACRCKAKQRVATSTWSSRYY